MHKQVAAKPTKPAGWQETVDGVKQACWCGEQWSDMHEDGNHAEEEVPAAVLPPRKKAKRAKMTKKAKAAKAKAAKAARAARAAAVESDEEIPEGYQKGWYGPVPCEE